MMTDERAVELANLLSEYICEGIEMDVSLETMMKLTTHDVIEDIITATPKGGVVKHNGGLIQFSNFIIDFYDLAIRDES